MVEPLGGSIAQGRAARQLSDGVEILQRRRSRQLVALHEIDSELREAGQRLGALDALTDGGDPKCAGHLADGLDQAAVDRIVARGSPTNCPSILRKSTGIFFREWNEDKPAPKSSSAMRQPRFLTSCMKVTAAAHVADDRGLGDVEAQAAPDGRILDQGQHEFEKIALAERLRRRD